MQTGRQRERCDNRYWANMGVAVMGKSQSQAHTKSQGADRPQEPCARPPTPYKPCHSAQHFSAIKNTYDFRLSLPRGSDHCPPCKAIQFKQQVLQLSRAQGSSELSFSLWATCDPPWQPQHTLPYRSTLPETKHPAHRREGMDSHKPEEKQDEGLMQIAAKDYFLRKHLTSLFACWGESAL